MPHPRLANTLTALLMAIAISPPVAAKEPSLDEVIERLAAYVAGYGPHLADIVAEEHYTQSVETEPGTVIVPDVGVRRRVIRSDVVVTRPAQSDTWVALRDTYDVDGVAVRDREDRLVALLSAGGEAAWRRAAAIANESARFNIGSDLITRNVNVPTFVLQLLDESNRRRFRLTRASQGRGDGRASGVSSAVQQTVRWEIAYRERDRPTLVRQGSGDQPLRGSVTVDPETGEIWGTHLTWERGPGGAIDVVFGRVPGIDVLVPVRMVESYRSRSITIRGEATYSNFRRFQTSSRVVTPEVAP